MPPQVLKEICPREISSITGSSSHEELNHPDRYTFFRRKQMQPATAVGRLFSVARLLCVFVRRVGNVMALETSFD